MLELKTTFFSEVFVLSVSELLFPELSSLELLLPELSLLKLSFCWVSLEVEEVLEDDPESDDSLPQEIISVINKNKIRKRHFSGRFS